MGFTNRVRLSSELGRLMTAVEGRDALTLEDWQRVLVATEVVFASDVFGSGLDWSTTTGFSDADTIALLRAVQRKMPRWRSSYQFGVADDGQVTIHDATARCRRASSAGSGRRRAPTSRAPGHRGSSRTRSRRKGVR